MITMTFSGLGGFGDCISFSMRVWGALGVLYYSIHYHSSSGHSFNHGRNAFLSSTLHRSHSFTIYSSPHDRCTRKELPYPYACHMYELSRHARVTFHQPPFSPHAIQSTPGQIAVQPSVNLHQTRSYQVSHPLTITPDKEHVSISPTINLTLICPSHVNQRHSQLSRQNHSNRSPTAEPSYHIPRLPQAPQKLWNTTLPPGTPLPRSPKQGFRSNNRIVRPMDLHWWDMDFRLFGAFWVTS
jgi:hypothetical protein